MVILISAHVFEGDRCYPLLFYFIFHLFKWMLPLGQRQTVLLALNSRAYIMWRFDQGIVLVKSLHGFRCVREQSFRQKQVHFSSTIDLDD